MEKACLSAHVSCAEDSMATEMEMFHSRQKPYSQLSTDPERFSAFAFSQVQSFGNTKLALNVLS